MNGENNQVDNTNNSQKILVLSLLFLILLIIVVFLVAVIFKRINNRQVDILEISDTQSMNKEIENKSTNSKPEEKANPKNEDTLEIVPPLAGEASKVSDAEKKALGIPDFVKVEAVSRDDEGRITGHRTIQEGEDSDGDGISDVIEDELGTNKNSADTDQDGIGDWQEVATGKDPTKADNYSKKD